MTHFHPCDLSECAASGYQPPPVTLAEAIDSLPETHVECLVWFRDHNLHTGANIDAVIGAIRADLQKLAGGENRG